MSPTKAPSPPPVRVMRADARRNRAGVLKAARHCFARDGLDAQMEDIARRAGVGVGTVYRHYPTKDDLIEALALDRFERLAKNARTGLADPDPWHGFEEFMRSSARLQAGDQALSEIIGERPQMMREAAESVQLLDIVGELIARAQETGQMRPEIVPEDVPMLVCGLARAPRAGSIGPETQWGRYLAIVLDGLRAGAGSLLPPRE